MINKIMSKTNINVKRKFKYKKMWFLFYLILVDYGIFFAIQIYIKIINKFALSYSY